jgi:hypothetical protein
MGKKKHNPTVRAAAKRLKADRGSATLHVDHVAGPGWAPAQPLPDGPPDLVTAFMVPTQGLFSKTYVALNPDDLAWRHPDVVVEEDGRRYIVEVGHSNESSVRTARKLETMLHGASRWNVCGIALVKTDDGQCDKFAPQLERMRDTFWTLFGPPREHADRNRIVPYLRVLLEREPFKTSLGAIDWDRIKELDAARKGWEDQLAADVKKAFEDGNSVVR